MENGLQRSDSLTQNGDLQRSQSVGVPGGLNLQRSQSVGVPSGFDRVASNTLSIVGRRTYSAPGKLVCVNYLDEPGRIERITGYESYDNSKSEDYVRGIERHQKLQAFFYNAFGATSRGLHRQVLSTRFEEWRRVRSSAHQGCCLTHWHGISKLFARRTGA